MCLRVFCLRCWHVWVVVHSVMLSGVLACVYDCGVCLLCLWLRAVCELLCDVVWSVAVVCVCVGCVLCVV